MSRVVTVVGAQVRPVAWDPAATFDRFAAHVRTLVAAFPSGRMLVFPELYLSAVDPFTVGPDGYELGVAESVPGPTTRRVGEVAREAGLWIVAGSILERSEAGIYNTAIVCSPAGELVASYRKMFPWPPFETTLAGEAPCVFDVPGVGRFGVMICYDGWFPEVPRALALMGAECILQPTLTTTPDRDEELVLARANAIVNQCYLLSINASASMGGGRSIGVDPEGRVMFLGGGAEEYLPEVLDLDRVATVRITGTRALAHPFRDVLRGPPLISSGLRTLAERRHAPGPEDDMHTA